MLPRVARAKRAAPSPALSAAAPGQVEFRVQCLISFVQHQCVMVLAPDQRPGPCFPLLSGRSAECPLEARGDERDHGQNGCREGVNTCLVRECRCDRKGQQRARMVPGNITTHRGGLTFAFDTMSPSAVLGGCSGGWRAGWSTPPDGPWLAAAWPRTGQPPSQAMLPPQAASLRIASSFLPCPPESLEASVSS